MARGPRFGAVMQLEVAIASKEPLELGKHLAKDITKLEELIRPGSFAIEALPQNNRGASQNG